MIVICDHTDEFMKAILAGICRCCTGGRSISLENYYSRHKDEIQTHAQKDQIIEAFRARKEELSCFDKKFCQETGENR